MLHYPSLNRSAHTGFVTALHPEDGSFDTIEGNTDDGGSRESWCVFRRTRRARLLHPLAGGGRVSWRTSFGPLLSIGAAALVVAAALAARAGSCGPLIGGTGSSFRS